MKFEQAFYTRGYDLINESGTGLGILASSNLEQAFLESCMGIGSMFDTERSDETAQFVVYSDIFQTFVGVGVSPATNADGGNVNKLCHMFVPIQEGDDLQRFLQPENYYLDYPFLRNMEKRRELEAVELAPCMDIRNYHDILKKYKMDKQKLAYFLYELFPILFGEKNLLLIVLDNTEYRKEDYAMVAREMTWLASLLVPGKEYASDYRKELSYSVYSTRNMCRVAHIAYLDEENLSKIEGESGNYNGFFLGRRAEIEIPELYYVLAEKGLESQQEYLATIDTILEGKKERKIGSGKLQEAYFCWKLSNGEAIQRQELPWQMIDLIERASCNLEYRDILIKCILMSFNFTGNELINIWRKIIQPELDGEMKMKKLDTVIERMLVLMYPKNENNYMRFIEKIPDSLCSVILEHLYLQEGSCIQKHLDTIQTIDEFCQMSKLYCGICEIQKYKTQMRQIVDKIKDEEEIPKKIRLWVPDYLIYLINEKEETIKKYQEALWKKCEDDLPSKLFCAWLFKNNRYSIWTEILFGDMKQYEEIFQELERVSKYRFMKEEPLQISESTVGKWKQAELNRACYCLWKQVVKQSDCDVQVLESYNVFYYKKEVLQFFDNLERIMIMEARERDCIIYLKLLLRKEKRDLSVRKSTYSERAENYRKLKEEAPLFYKAMLRISADGKDSDIAERLEEIRRYEMQNKGNVNYIYQNLLFEIREKLNYLPQIEEELLREGKDKDIQNMCDWLESTCRWLMEQKEQWEKKLNRYPLPDVVNFHISNCETRQKSMSNNRSGKRNEEEKLKQTLAPREGIYKADYDDI